MSAIIWIVLVGVIIYAAKYGKKERPKETDTYVIRERDPGQDGFEDPSSQRQADPVKINIYTDCYQAKYLLTRHEWYEFKKLREFARAKNLIICPKVRLLDIIVPREDKKNRKALLWKVQSKHVDFVICDENMHIKAILELDDSSHDRQDRIERDHFVDEILTSVGYKVIHTRCITENTLNGL